MGDVKSWIVTYTKHIRQKRKIYQDGTLEIHGSSNKVMLFDDSGKFLDCRLLKKEEVVGSGETLAFGSYLVDVGDTIGSHEHLTDFTTQERNKKPDGTNRITHGQKARNISAFIEKRTDVGNTTDPQGRPNVTKNITREYKKNELESKAPKSRLSTTKTTVTEWHALYTTQITQKFKKYHDGFLRLSICGSQGRQVMLYDGSRKLLDTRFLKKDEVIGPGETLALDAHLVDIGDPKGKDTEVVENTRIAHGEMARHCSSAENGNKEMKNQGSLQGCINTAQTSMKEWHALYTTQITQKAKRYHDGILQLAFCSPRGKQVILLNEEGTKLSNKYIKFSEDVKTGSTLELTNYLVEIGEPRELKGVEHSGKSQKDASSGEGAGLNSSSYIADNLELHRGIARSTPLRDAQQILSVLKKPMESVEHTRKVPVEQSNSSHTLYSIQYGTQDQLPTESSQRPKYFERNDTDDHGYDPKNLNGARTASFNTCRSEILPYTDKMMVKTAQSVAEPQASDVIILDLPEDTIPSECSGLKSLIPMDVNVTSNQFQLDSIRNDSSLSGSASCISTDGERENSEAHNIPNQIVHLGELPSFDLGI